MARKPDRVAALAVAHGNDNAGMFQRTGQLQQSGTLDQGQVARQHQPAIGIWCGAHGGCNGVTHARVTGVFDVIRQSTGLHGVKYMLQHRLSGEQRLEFVNLAPRRQKALAPA